MKKKITAVFMAATMAFGLVACGPAENPDAILHPYTPYQYSDVYMPAEITTDQEMYDALEYVIDKAMGDGATFRGVPAFSMSKGYFRQETANLGYEHQEYTRASLSAKADNYLIDISNYKDFDETAPVNEILLQVFNMGKEDFDPQTLDNINRDISIGQSQQLLGKSTQEMFEYLEISDLMLEFIKYFGSSGKADTKSSTGTMYSLSWYKGDNARYSIIYTEGYYHFYGTDTVSISFRREENGHHQDINYSNVVGGPVCSARYNETVNTDEEYLQNFAKAAEEWRTAESMVDTWIITEKTENGVSTALDFDWNTYLELDWGNRGWMKVPVFADSDVEIKWTKGAAVLQENPDEKLVFVVTVDNHRLPSVLMEYHYADDSIVIKNDENTLAYKFERIA